jgi:hypothetical protein
MEDLRAQARQFASEAGIDPGIFERQIQQESGFNPKAYNAGSGATGIAQIIPRFHPNVDPTDPVASLRYAANWMRTLLAQFGESYPHALAAYNWGPGNVARWDGKRGTLPGETRGYLDVILGKDWTAGAAGPGAALAYDPDEPEISQNDQWSCAPSSLRWALWSVGRQPSEQWIESTMLAQGVVSTGAGLLDASGAGLAAFVEREYGYDCGSSGSVSYDDVVRMAGSKPVLIGGRSWGAEGHWSGVRRYDPNQGLLLANPANGYGGIGQVINRQQWSSRGPWSAMWIEVVGAVPVEPGPTEPSVSVDELRGVIREYEGQVASLRSQLEAFWETLYVFRDDEPSALRKQADRMQKNAEKVVGKKA